MTGSQQRFVVVADKAEPEVAAEVGKSAVALGAADLVLRVAESLLTVEACLPSAAFPTGTRGIKLQNRYPRSCSTYLVKRECARKIWLFAVQRDFLPLDCAQPTIKGVVEKGYSPFVSIKHRRSNSQGVPNEAQAPKTGGCAPLYSRNIASASNIGSEKFSFVMPNFAPRSR